MKNLELITVEQAKPEAKEILTDIQQKLGKVPNIYAAMANSPVALKALLNYGETLSHGQFNPKEIEAIDLAVAQQNNCAYCLSAHTALAKMKGFSEEETLSLRKGDIVDPKLKALTALAKEIVSTQGHPQQELIEAFLKEGYNKGALVELIAAIAKDIFTNYFNHIAGTDVDFPKVKPVS